MAHLDARSTTKVFDSYAAWSQAREMKEATAAGLRPSRSVVTVFVSSCDAQFKDAEKFHVSTMMKVRCVN